MIDARSCDGGPAATDSVPASSTTSTGPWTATVPSLRNGAARRIAPERDERGPTVSSRGSGACDAATRTAASASRSSPSLPSRTAATIAVRTRATWPCVDVVPQAEGIGSGAERKDGPFLHPDRRAHRLHLERIGDGHACESELVPQQARQDGGAERGGQLVELRHDEMGRHDGARAGGDRRAERRQLRLQQLLARRRDDGEAEVRVDRRCRRGPGSAWRTRRLRPPGDRARMRAT